MTAAELCQRLGITRHRLEAWCRRGLPSTKGSDGRRHFDPQTTRDWLLAEGICTDANAPPPPPAAAEPPPAANVVKTIGQVARHFNVSDRQVGYWKGEGMPSGPTGKGPYDLGAIEAWLAGKKQAVGSTAQDELMQIRARRERLELARDEQVLVDKDLPARIFGRHLTEAAAQHSQMVDRLMASVQDMPEDRQRRWRQIAEKASQEVRLTLAAALEEWADQLDQLSRGK